MSDLYQIHQLDKKLLPVRAVKELSVPRGGWIATIRETLGMTQGQLARRLKISRSRMKKIEESEVEGALKLTTLERVANGLGCKAHYVLLPEGESLAQSIEAQANRIAKASVIRSAQHMILEDQEALKEVEQQVQLLTQKLLHKKLKELWKYEV